MNLLLLRRRAVVVRDDLPLPSAAPVVGRGPGIAASTRHLFWGWALGAGVAVFAAWWLQRRGLWGALVDGDPSGISLAIIGLAVLCTAWCGRRAWTLTRQVELDSPWRAAWRIDCVNAPTQATQLLSERSHGPHETAWWFAGAAIKLGLLGTVVGFIFMSLQLSRMPGFDIEHVQALLSQMTQGMAIALYTTLVGLAANLWLGLQLLLLDRMADRVVADIVSLEGGAR